MISLSSLCSTDQRTHLGRTLTKIAEECSCDLNYLTSNVVKMKMKYFAVPDIEVWSVSMVREMLDDDMKISVQPDAKMTG